MIELLPFEPTNCLILAVDDVVANLKILQGLLSPLGYRVTFATEGKHVLERTQRGQPDLILLDLMMPEMNGIEVCQQLKQSPATADIPIIFLTASHEVDHLVQAFASGAVDYITKPFNATELLIRVRTHLELSQLRKQAQLQATWEAIVRQIVQDIHTSIDLQEVLETAVNAIQQCLGAERVMVYRWGSPESCELMAIAGQESGPGIGAQQAVSRGESESFPAQPPLEWPLPDTRRELRLPINREEQRWGELVIQHDPTARSSLPGESAMLTLIAQQLGISIQNAALHQRLQEVNQELQWVSNTDGLTQIANRRCFDHRLAQEWQRSQREQQPIALILCDIDYFKQFNDTYGHPGGDTCLVAIAQALQRCLKRPADFLARYGGEEFVVLLPNTPLAGAIEVVQQMQQAIAALNIPHGGHSTATCVTLSFGIMAIVPRQLTDMQDLLTQADRALYEANRTRSLRHC